MAAIFRSHQMCAGPGAPPTVANDKVPPFEVRRKIIPVNESYNGGTMATAPSLGIQRIWKCRCSGCCVPARGSAGEVDTSAGPEHLSGGLDLSHTQANHFILSIILGAVHRCVRCRNMRMVG